MKRAQIYQKIAAWTSPPIYILMVLQLITGLGSIKGREFASVSLGIIPPADTGKLHTVWLVLLVGIFIYLHGTAGLGVLISRAKFIHHKLPWEIAMIVVSLALFTQFFILYLL
ncbi:MAG: hypothetical protein ACYC6L_14445 [Anaerolineae bacterium]